MCARIPVFLGQTKVNDINLVATFAQTHQKVVRFDVSVDKVFGVDILDSGDLN